MSLAESQQPESAPVPENAEASLRRLASVQDEAASAHPLPSAREQAIPVRKSALLDALIEHGQLASAAEKDAFRRLARLLALIYHYEFFDRLERLRDAYHGLDPDRDGHDDVEPLAREQAYEALRALLLDVLHSANFVEISHDEIERAHKEHAIVRVEVRASLDDFREVRLFRRGHRHEQLTVADWWGLRKRVIAADVYRDVVLLVGAKPQSGKTGNVRMPWRSKRSLRPGSMLIKSFRDIASADLNALMPNIRVVMSTLDRLILTVPAIAGGLPIIFNLASTVTVLFLVAGFYLGLVGSVHDDDMKKALAAVSGMVALGGFLMRQWLKYQRQSLKYHKELADTVYYRNVNNNAGLFDSLIATAEAQDCKEAFLACYFLLTASEPLTQAALDQQIEQWLQQRFALDVEFEVKDALAKLDRLGILQRDGEMLRILPMGEIVTRLEAVWVTKFRSEAA